MSLRSRMRTRFLVYERTAEADTLTQKAALSGYMTALTADGARRQSALAEPDITHSGRFPVNPELQAGRRLRRVVDDAEFVIRVVRQQGPPPYQHHVLCAEVEPAVT